MVIESLEPRLLLSVGPVSQAALQAMHDNLLNLETVLKGLESVGTMADTAALISANGSTTAGGITAIHSTFDNTVIAAINAELKSPNLSSDLASSTALATALNTQLQNIVGTSNGSSASVTDVSGSSGAAKLEFQVTDVVSSSFALDFGAVGTSGGISVPDTTGNALTITTHFDFTTSIDPTLSSSATTAQGESAFSVSGTHFDVSLNATADLSGKEFDVGILALTVDPANPVPISVHASLTSGTLTSLSGTVLNSDASGITGGDNTSITGGSALLTYTIATGQSSGTLVDIPLLLTEDHTIPGITPITTDVHLTVTGHAVGTDEVVSVDALTTALQTATGNPNLVLADLNTFLPAGLATELSQVGKYLDSLSNVPNLDVVIPFTDGTTIGQVTDLATAFNDLIIKPLESTVGAIGFTEGQTNSSGQAAGYAFIEGTAITAAEISALPNKLSVQLALNDGLEASINLSNTYLDSNGAAHKIASVDNLVTAVNQAIAATPLLGFVSAMNDNGKLELALTNPPSGSSPSTAATGITVSSPSGSSLFTNIRSFGVALAKILQLPGYDATETTASDTTLLTELGLGYDGATNALTFSISHEFDLPSVSTSFNLNFDLGNVASLSVTNATLNVVPSVYLNLTIGLSLDPLGSDVNQPGGPTIGDGSNGTTDVKLSAIPVVELASNNGTIPLTADAIAAAAGASVTTGLPDLQVIGREGAVATIEINPDWSLSQLENAILQQFSAYDITLSFDPTTHKLNLIDTYTPYSGPTPTDVGLTSGTLAQAAQTGSDSADYQAVLAGVAPAASTWSQDTKFILSIGTLAPIVVDVAAGAASSVSTFASALNAALASVSVDPTQLGLPSSDTLHYSDLVHAAVDSSGGISLTTTIFNAIHSALGGDPQTNAQRVAVQWGVEVRQVDLMVTALNGSLLPGVLGLVGNDINAVGSAQSEVVGAPLDGETLADRLEFENTGISLKIDVSLVPTDPSQPVTISGSLGPMSFTAPLDPDNVYVSIKASLLLNDDANATPDVVTLHQLTSSISDGTFLSLWSFTLASGRDGQPFAEIDIKGLDVSAGSVDLASAAQPEIIISLGDPNVLLSGSLPKPTVQVLGFDSNLAAADVLSAIAQTFNQLDGSLANATIPLVDVSLDQILNLGSKFLVALDAAEADPAGTLTAIQNDLNSALGGNYVTLSLDSNNDIIIHIAYQPLAVSETLPFNLNLTDLTSFLGSDGGALASLASAIGSVSSASATGNLNITAGVSLALTLGINLGANDVPAATTDLLSALNGGKGLRTGTAGMPDLQVTLGNGKSFSVSVAGLGSTATVQNLIDLLNTQAAADGVSNFATYDATTGKLTLADNSTSPAVGLAALGLSGVTGNDTGTSYQLVGTTALTDADAGKAYTFDVKIGTGVTAEVDVAADSTRTTVASLVSAIRDAISATTISSKDLANELVVLPGSAGQSTTADYQVSLGQIVSVKANLSGDLVLSAKDSVLGTASNGSVINLLTLVDATPKLTTSITSLNGSHVAEDLGLGSDAATTTGTGTRSFTGTLTEPGATSNRFFLETGTDSSGNVLTGIDATIGINASDLNFTAGIGALSAKIVNGTASIGLDTGKVAAGATGFAVGDPATAPATFEISLNDGFGGATAGDGILTFGNLAKLGSAGNSLSDLVKFTADAAISVNLPVTVLGQDLGPIVLQIGNLFNTTDVTGLPARTVSTSFPSFSNISIGSILNDPQELIDGLDAFLSTLSGGAFANEIYSLNLPLIGPALRDIGSFFTTLHNDVIGELQSLLNSFEASHPGQPASTQNIITQGLNYILQLLHLPGEVYSYIDNINDPTEISFVWTFTDTLLATSVNLSSDLGIPGLGLNLSNGQAYVDVNLNATLGFGYEKGKGFFVYDMGSPGALTSFTSNNDPNNVYTANFTTTHALDLGIAVFLDPSFTASLNIGFLTAQATNGSTLTATVGFMAANMSSMTITGTSLTGDLYVDIGPNETTGRLLFNQFSSQTVVRAYVDTTLNVDLNIKTGFGFGSVSSALPNVLTELEFSYSYAKALTGELPDGVTSGIITPITFVNVSLDLGAFLSGFLKPILDDIHQVTGPIQPFLDFITAPIPGISQIIGPTSILDIAGLLGVPGVADAKIFIQVVDEINALDALANSGSGELLLNFGTFVLGHAAAGQTSVTSGNVDPFSSSTAVSSADTSAAQASLVNAGASALSSAFASGNSSQQSAGSAISSLQNNTNGRGGKPVIDFPILHDPMALLGLLMGQTTPVDLVHVTLPTFKFSFNWSKEFDFFIGPVPVEVTISAGFSVAINLAFGFDTSGIERFLSDHNPLEIFDGLYIDDTLGPQLTFTADFELQAGIDLVLVQAGLGGELTATIAFQLHDPSGTGKIHASVLLEELINNPLDLFDISGELDLKIFAWYWVGIDVFGAKITLVQGQINIIDVTLLSFSYSYADAHSTPQLAHQTGTTAQLNIGANADQQEAGGNLYNANQAFTVNGNGANGISVSGPSSSQTYTGVNTITANVGTGNNDIVFNNVQQDVTITGGGGNDTLDLRGVTVDPVITLSGNGNNLIYGAANGVTTITATGSGNNTIYGGGGAMIITLGDGNNTIVGGNANDTIIVGSGNNTIWGGAGSETITVGGGNNTIWGGLGSNVITVHNGAGNNVIFGNGPGGAPSGLAGDANTRIATATTTITSTQISDNAVSAQDGNNTITGGNGNDFIFGGGGSNTITGGAGNDVIFGSTGTITLDGVTGGNEGVVKAVATTTIGGNNTITGGGGDSIIFGGNGQNVIGSGAGNDVIVGNIGTVDGPKGGTNGLFTTTETVGTGGTDIITLGSGTDAVVTGAGANTVYAGIGNDIIVAHEGTIVRDGALGREVDLYSVRTTDESATPGALVEGGTGNDFILGGGGNNVIHAGTYDSGTGLYDGAGFNVILGAYGTVTTSTLTSAQQQEGAYQALTVTGVDGAAAGNGNNLITTDNTAIIMGGGGNNTIMTNEGTLAQDVVFGANGQVVADSLLAGGIKLHTAQTLLGEEKIGGTNNISIANGSDVIFGGAGNASIGAGNGNDVIIAHIGVVNYDRLASPDRTGLTPDIIGYYRSQDGVLLSSTGDIVTAGNGRDVIIGGTGNNTITAGTGTDIVFGAAGEVTRDGTNNNALLVAQTIEESLSGNNTLTIGVAGNANDVIFGGLGHNTIAAGAGNNVILGHLGEVNYAYFASFSTLQRSDGSRPDVIGRYLPEIGSAVSGAPVTPGLDVIPTAGAYGSTITAGDGNNVVIGGAGNNTISVGQGNNVLFGAAGSVTRDATSQALVFATTLEEQYGGNDVITATNGNNDIFGGIGNNLIRVGDRTNVVLAHLGEVDIAAETEFTTAQRNTGLHPDIISRSIPELGNTTPQSYEGDLGLDRPVTNTSSTVYAGNGTNIIMGGAGNNTIVAGLGLNTIFGASGAVTRNPVNQQIIYAETVEETIGGNNVITAGLRSTVGEQIFGGIGANQISVGSGNNIILGHLGVIDIANLTNYTSAQRDTGLLPDVWGRIVPEVGNILPNTVGGQAGLNTSFITGNDTIGAGNGNNIIIGGGGNNTITAGAGTNVVFGADGAVTRDARTRNVVIAQTIEESLGGNETISVGVGARNATNTIFGGEGTNIITAGGASDVILGHLGTVNVTTWTTATATALAAGTAPDIVSRTVPVYGNVSPVTTGGPLSGLGSPITGGSTITAGNGNDIILGGAGNNTITAGNGNDVVFGASGAVTRSPTAGVGVITAVSTEVPLSGNNVINVGTGVDEVFGGQGSAAISTLGTADVLFGQTGSIYLVSGNQTLAGGSSLAALAVAAQSQATPLPTPVSPAVNAIRPAGSTFILDSTHGYWVTDVTNTDGPVLILDGVDAPELVLDVTQPIETNQIEIAA
jgi:Ca2+-binding RTX toxin-like protein